MNKEIKFVGFIMAICLLMVSSATLSNALGPSSEEPTLRASLLSQNPDPAHAGDVVDIRIKLANNGDKSTPPIMGEIIPEFPFSVADGEQAQQFVSELPNFPSEDASKILEYTLLVSKDAIDKIYDLKFRYSIDGGSSWIIETFQVRITSQQFAQIIHVDKSKIDPGSETPLTFTINNIGKSPLSNLVFTWSEKNNVILPVNSDNTRYIPYLGVGESSNLEYDVVANPSGDRGLYNLDLTLTYDAIAINGSVQKSKIVTNAGILVGGGTDFDIAFADSTSGKTSLSIANSGKNDASSVSISLPDQDGFTVKGGSSVIIGNLNKGDFTLATFQILPKPPVQNEETRYLKIDISFTDSFGERHNVEDTLSLKVNPRFGQDLSATANNRSSSSTTWIIALIVLIVVVFFGYRMWKKSKK